MLELILTVLLQAAVVLLVARFVPGVQIKGYGTALSVALVYGLLSLALKPILELLTFLPMLLTLGAFVLVINAFLLWITDKLLSSFKIRGWASMTLATVAITAGYSLVSWIVRSVV